MKRQLVRPLVAWAARWFDDTVSVERLHALLLGGLRDFRKRAMDGGAVDAAAEMAGDVALACRLAVEAGLWSTGDDLQTAVARPPAPSHEEIQKWIESVPDGKTITAKRLVAGAGRWLDRIELAGRTDWDDFVRRNLEALLRNVEIRRTRCLRPLLPAATPDVQWIEKHDVAILFARTARRRGDLRFLNAALKLNDWAFPTHRRLRWEARSTRYLLALAEQERSAAELCS